MYSRKSGEWSMVILHRTTTENPRPGQLRSRALRVLFAAAGVLALLFQADVGDVFPGRSVRLILGAAASVTAFSRSHLPEFMRESVGGHGILFVIDPGDFGCPPCFEDLQRLAEEVGKRAKADGGGRGAFLVRQASLGPWSDSTFVRRWADAQGFSFPIVMVPETTYTAFHLRKTSVLVVDASMKPIMAEEIPMKGQTHLTIRSLMEE